MQNFDALHKTASRQFGVLTLEQLGAAGLNKGQIAYQVKKGFLRRRKGGVVTVGGSPCCWEQDVAAAALSAQPTGAASHRSAARFWGFRSVDAHVEIAIPYPQRLILPDVVVHRSIDLLPIDCTWYEGVPVTTPERTLCDLGLIFPQTEVMRILRHAVSTAMVNRRDVWMLRKRISKSGRDGAGVIGRCLDDLPQGAEYTESGLEVMLLEICEDFGLATPSIQVPIVVGGSRYRLDFAYPAQKVFIEVDGRPTHSLPTQIARDGGRQNDLVTAGWKPLRFDYLRLRNNPESCAQEISQALCF